MSAKQDAETWAATARRSPSGATCATTRSAGSTPPAAPAALCPGGSNRLTGQLSRGLLGRLLRRRRARGGLAVRKSVLPGRGAGQGPCARPGAGHAAVQRRVAGANAEDSSSGGPRTRSQFESIEFNKRFLATVPSEYDPVALREMFGPGFLDWVTTIDREIDFGVSEGQLYFHWRLRERTREEYEAALDAGAGLFTRVCREVEEHGVHTYQPGPWHAGLEPFPDEPRGAAGSAEK